MENLISKTIKVNTNKVIIKKRKDLSRDNVEFLALTIPVLILAFIFSYLPMFGLILAFKDFRANLGIFESKFVGLKNFEFFFTSQDAFRVTRNTVGLNILFIFTGTVAALFLAFVMYELRSKTLLKTYQTIAILPNFLSWVVVAFMTYALLSPEYGVINQIITGLGFPRIQWYGEAKWWPGLLTILNIWKGAGMGALMYYAALIGLDQEYFEAAAIDGASRWQLITQIALPGITPLIVILTILGIGGMFRSDFGMFYQITRDSGALYSTTDVIDTYVYRALRVQGEIGMSTAVGLYQSLVGFVLILITNTVVRKIDEDSSLY